MWFFISPWLLSAQKFFYPSLPWSPTLSTRSALSICCLRSTGRTIGEKYSVNIFCTNTSVNCHGGDLHFCRMPTVCFFLFLTSLGLYSSIITLILVFFNVSSTSLKLDSIHHSESSLGLSCYKWRFGRHVATEEKNDNDEGWNTGIGKGRSWL